MKRKWFAAPYGVWMVLFTVVPFFLVIFFSLTSQQGGFTLENFRQFFTPVYMQVLVRSIGMALLCTVICLLIGYPVALFLADRNLKNSAALILLIIIPMWMNFLLRTYAWLTLLESNGIITSLVNKVLAFFGNEKDVRLLYSYGAVLMGMVYNFLPFMILPIYNSLSRIDLSITQAAEDLGASPFNVFWRVTLPLSIPGVTSGITMVFMPAVTTFVISRLLGGAQFKLFGDLIEQQFLFTGDWNFGSALSLVMLILILLSVGFMNKFDKSGEGRSSVI